MGWKGTEMFGEWQGKPEGIMGQSPLPEPLRDIQTYWESLCRLDRLPARAEVDPAGIERALSHAFVLERIAPSVARVRVGGQVLNTFLGTEARGLPFSFGFGMTSRALIGDVLKDVFDAPVTARLWLEDESKAPCPCEMILLPLAGGRDGAATRILGGLAFGGEQAPRSHRWRLINSERRAINTSQTPLSVCTQATHVPHLRLVVDRT
jgi:hypothetical protein